MAHRRRTGARGCRGGTLKANWHAHHRSQEGNGRARMPQRAVESWLARASAFTGGGRARENAAEGSRRQVDTRIGAHRRATSAKGCRRESQNAIWHGRLSTVSGLSPVTTAGSIAEGSPRGPENNPALETAKVSPRNSPHKLTPGVSTGVLTIK